VKGEKRGNKIKKIKATDYKKHRIKKKSKMLRKETRLAAMERAKRNGTYKSGMEMIACSSDDDTSTEKPPPVPTRNKRAPKIFVGSVEKRDISLTKARIV
jgi:hypothetical protein